MSDNGDGVGNHIGEAAVDAPIASRFVGERRGHGSESRCAAAVATWFQGVPVWFRYGKVYW